MIQELKNFVEHISKNDKDVFARNLQLKEGIYVLLDIEKQDGNFVLLNEKEVFDTKEDILVYDGKSEVENKELYNLFLLRMINSTVVGSGKNKSLNSSSGIFMFTANPFGIGLKKERYALGIEDSLQTYFKSAFEYVKEQHHINWHDAFRGFSLNRLLTIIPQLPFFEELNKKHFIFFFLKKPTLEDYIKVHQAYLEEKVFNKKEFNVPIEKETFGISDSLSGFNDKKIFLKHHTAPLEYNYRVDGKVAMQLWRFFQLQQNKQIPNPVPIFIDEEELNTKMISIFNSDKDRKMGHAEMIRIILSQSNKKELQNYYLIYFQGTKGSRVIDIDFIPLFKYEEKEAQISEVFDLEGSQAKNKIENVFDLENFVFNRIFNGQLKTETWLKYFGEIKYDKYLTDTTYNQLLKYRQSIYDFIYKSKRQAITSMMFDDMMRQGIADDIRHDEKDSKKNQHTKQDSIKEKLNIWFSLYDFFTNTTQKNRENMVNETQELFIKLKELAKPENEQYLQDDKAFAFSVGQIIYYLLNQSEAGNRSHALLEPFLQKTDANQLKLAIARTFDTYKHAIKFYRSKFEFDKLMSEVMGYVPDEKNMKNLLPFILAGYFSKSIFSKDKTEN